MASLKLPSAFEMMMKSKLNEDYPSFKDALELAPPVSIRKNIIKYHSNGQGELRFDGERPIEWCEDGYYLPSRPSFTSDPLFHAGCYYVQEASSMFVNQFVRQHIGDAPVIALDLCAAPGGKSTLLLSILPAGSLLFSNEISRQRCQILKENLIKWGNPNVIVTNNDANDYQRCGLQFDLILCDAPCSGEGMFRKDPQTINEWNEQSVSTCSHRQREILSDIWPSLKPGGILLYSTCTYNSEEDEQNARYICKELGGTPLKVDISPSWGIDQRNFMNDPIPVYHFFPHKAQGEGFFICGFQKDENAPDESYRNASTRKKSSREAGKKMKKDMTPSYIKEWVSNSNSYSFSQLPQGDVYAFPKVYSPLLAQAISSLHVIHHGIHVGSPKGKGFKPTQCLAMSNHLNQNSFPSIELDYSTAISYLRCESLYLPSAPQGMVLLCHKGYPLGFVNNLGTRANNMYPDEWRIRKQSLF